MLLLLFISISYGWLFCMNGEEWCIPPDFESKEDLWLVTFKTWERNYGSPFRYLMACGDGTDDCNVPWHWKFETKFFPTRKGAMQWINREFSKDPERMVSIRRINPPEKLANKVIEHVEAKVTKTTEWIEKWDNQTTN